MSILDCVLCLCKSSSAYLYICNVVYVVEILIKQKAEKTQTLYPTHTGVNFLNYFALKIHLKNVFDNFLNV